MHLNVMQNITEICIVCLSISPSCNSPQKPLHVQLVLCHIAWHAAVLSIQDVLLDMLTTGTDFYQNVRRGWD